MTGGEPPRAVKQADPCTLVVFGASGDLMHRLLFSALYNLAAGGLLPDAFALIGVGRSEMSDDAFREDLRKSLHQFATRSVEEKIVQRLLGCATYVRGDADEPASYDRLRQALQRIEAERGTKGNRLFYMATPPSAFRPIACQLGRSRLACEENGSWRRIIIEKPFGMDLASARKLNHELLDVFDEEPLYRIDHYLGKETVQNILVLRFANGLFEPIWNRDHIDHVQITVAETLAVGRRGRFYDETGALRDMVPNHLFQLLSLVTMEPPSRFEAGAVRSEKAEVLDAVLVPSEAEALRNSVRGQYTRGHAGNNPIEDYRATPNVRPDSTTETYAALKLQIDNWRWAGVLIFPSYREGVGDARDRGCDQVQAGAVRDVSRHTDRPPGAELPGAGHPAGRMHLSAVQRQGAGPVDQHRRGGYDVPLQGLFRCGAVHRLRDSHLRLYDRGRDPVSAGRWCRGGLARRAAFPRRLAKRRR